MNLIDSVKRVLANNFALYLKAHYYHWNVEGPDFSQFHTFFGNFYESVYESVDKFAEEIRALDAYAPGSFERYIQLSDIKGDDRVPRPLDMVQQLMVDNNLMIGSLKEAYQLAEEGGALGLANFIQDRIDVHSKWGWMLKSFNKAI